MKVEDSQSMRRPKCVTKVQKTIMPAAGEFVGTFGLVFFGCGTVCIEAENVWGSFVSTLAFVGIIFAQIVCFDTVSGSHFNPAVTLAFVMMREISILSAIGYVVAQLLGAISGAYMVKWLVPGAMKYLLGCTCLSWNHTLNPIAIYFLLIALVFAYGPISGASMNPARSLGPAIAANYWDDQYIYCTAPFVGSILGFLVFKAVNIHLQ
ncbi:MIP family channel protein [Pelomyxa schiedti]|nr:MIP family channel protein [Pelomyxa schiedti]